MQECGFYPTTDLVSPAPSSVRRNLESSSRSRLSHSVRMWKQCKPAISCFCAGCFPRKAQREVHGARGSGARCRTGTQRGSARGAQRPGRRSKALRIARQSDPRSPSRCLGCTSGDIRDQPKVADAASDLLQDIFGKNKSPCRLVRRLAGRCNDRGEAS